MQAVSKRFYDQIIPGMNDTFVRPVKEVTMAYKNIAYMRVRHNGISLPIINDTHNVKSSDLVTDNYLISPYPDGATEFKMFTTKPISQQILNDFKMHLQKLELTAANNAEA